MKRKTILPFKETKTLKEWKGERVDKKANNVSQIQGCSQLLT